MKAEQVQILVVDDDQVTCRMMRIALQQCGYLVHTVESCAVALATLATTPVDALIVDLNMPDMDGVDFCVALRKEPDYRHLPIIMVTGADDGKTINRAFEAGMTDFIAKPINLNLLNHRIRFALRATQALQQLQQSESRLLKAQRLARLGSWEWSAESDTVWWSEGATLLLRGESRQQVTPVWEFLAGFAPSSAALVHARLQRCCADNEPLEFELPLRASCGAELKVLLQGEALEAAPHPAGGVFGTILDITSHCRKAGAMQESQSP